MEVSVQVGKSPAGAGEGGVKLVDVANVIAQTRSATPSFLASHVHLMLDEAPLGRVSLPCGVIDLVHPSPDLYGARSWAGLRRDIDLGDWAGLLRYRLG